MGDRGRRLSRHRAPDERYEIPANFDANRLLSSAWGIMWDDEANQIILQISSSVTRGVRESVQHVANPCPLLCSATRGYPELSSGYLGY